MKERSKNQEAQSTRPNIKVISNSEEVRCLLRRRILNGWLISYKNQRSAIPSFTNREIYDIIKVYGKVEKRFDNYQIVVSRIINLTRSKNEE